MSDSPRTKFLNRFQDKELAAVVWDVMQQASNHDPDHAKTIRKLEGWGIQDGKKSVKLQSELDLAHRRLDRIGAPQYREIRKDGKHVGWAERVRGVEPGDYKLNVE